MLLPVLTLTASVAKFTVSAMTFCILSESSYCFVRSSSILVADFEILTLISSGVALKLVEKAAISFAILSIAGIEADVTVRKARATTKGATDKRILNSSARINIVG